MLSSLWTDFSTVVERLQRVPTLCIFMLCFYLMACGKWFEHIVNFVCTLDSRGGASFVCFLFHAFFCLLTTHVSTFNARNLAMSSVHQECNDKVGNPKKLQGFPKVKMDLIPQRSKKYPKIFGICLPSRWPVCNGLEHEDIGGPRHLLHKTH